MFVFKAAVVGAGTMGGEIAQAIAAADIPVVLKDVDQKFVDVGLQKAREVTEGQVARLVKKEKITEDQAKQQLEHTVGLITGTTEYEGFGDVDFVIEAVPERMPIKQTVFAELDACTPGHAILASNTSSLSISEMGEATSNFAQKIRKMPIRCGETPGFVVNRILNSAASEIWRYKDESGRSAEEIDKEIADAKVTPMGPFYLSDLLGLDTVLHVAEHLQKSYGERFYVSPEMKELVAAGNFGQKTGKGFYEHGGGQ